MNSQHDEASLNVRLSMVLAFVAGILLTLVVQGGMTFMVHCAR